jgi:hypothetical protein
MFFYFWQGLTQKLILFDWHMTRCNKKMMFQNLIILVVCLVGVVYGAQKQDIHIVLGSSDESILSERINTAIQYINASENPNILFISGGVKNAFAKETSEASRAANMINATNTNGYLQIVLEEKATNTAENFAYLKLWVNQHFSQDNLPDIVITTSDFHKNRAEQIFNGVIPGITPKWNLSKSACMRCWSEEHIHIKNLKADVQKVNTILLRM